MTTDTPKRPSALRSRAWFDNPANADMTALVTAAHARGMKVYMDIIINHTADVIKYRECPENRCAYRNRADYPYTRQGGVDGQPINEGFDGRDFSRLQRPDWAYTPYIPAGEENAKVPAWLNDPIRYHNRGESTFAGESSLDGDFAGLDDLLTEAAAKQGRTITPETFSERGLFYRADHFSVVRRGVPSLLLMALGGAPDLRQGGTAAGQRWLDGYMACYHKTCDRWSADWNLTGAAQDVDLFHDMGERLSHAGVWPTWSATSEFTATRGRTKAERR